MLRGVFHLHVLLVNDIMIPVRLEVVSALGFTAQVGASQGTRVSCALDGAHKW